MTQVFHIRVGKHQIGVVGLGQILKEMAEKGQNCSDQQIGTMMVEKLSEKNYIPPAATDRYASALLNEYKKFLGEPGFDRTVDGIEIKVLGAGCPQCDRLERQLMGVLDEMGAEADLEHVRDLKEISRYGVMGAPALVINGKVKTVGTVPSRKRLENYIREVQAGLKAGKE